MTELIKVGETINSMTSLQIAEVTGKDHKNVLRDIRSLLEQGINPLNFALVNYTDAKGEKRPMYELTKKDCFLLASGYDALLREKIINRWEELETKEIQKFQIPQTLSQALMLAAQQAEVIEKQQLQLTEQAPKVEFAESVKASIDDISIDELAKLIAQNGIEVGEKRLFKWMRDNNYLTKDNLPYQRWIERGYLKLDQKIRFNHEQKLVAYTQTRVTATGQIYF